MHWFSNLKLSKKLTFPIILGGVVVLSAAMAILTYVKHTALENSGLSEAQAVLGQAATVRQFYAAQIATRAKEAGMGLDPAFASKKGTLPVPATLIKVLGEEISKEHPGMALRLYSRHPFPSSAGAKYDAFEQMALSALEKDPKKPVSQLQEVNGRLSMRYAVADVMKEACVTCHNSHPESPKKDWRVGDLRGVMTVTVPVDVLEQDINKGMNYIGWSVFAGITLIALVGVFIARNVSQNVTYVADIVTRVERDGDFVQRAEVRSNDEVGEIARALNGLVNHFQKVVTEIRMSSAQVAQSADVLSASTAQVSAGTAHQSELAASTASAVEQVTVSIDQVAERSKEAAEISNQASSLSTESGRVVHNAASEMAKIAHSVTESSQLIIALGERSNQISGIVKVIKDIADQTNLLALNAAIEAARAGEQGRGFAVVADEVRKLAERTSGATTEISGMIDAIQAETRSAVTSMESGSLQVTQGVQLANQAAESLEQINSGARNTVERIHDIAAATREQGIASAEIAKNVEKMAQMSEENAAAVNEASSTAMHLRQLATNLNDIVSKFKV